MTAPSTYIFAGGGTGGHLFPGIAVAQELRRMDPAARLVFVGSTRVIESTIVTEHGLEHRMLPVESLTMLKRNPFRFAWRNWQSWRAATRLLHELQPTAVIGLGGFASAPVVFAAHRHHLPVVLLEQNVIPGRTTRWLGRYADRICVSFPEISPQLRRLPGVIVTGNPVREEIAALYSVESGVSSRSGQAPLRRELLILGGSQGADSLNAAVLAALRQTRQNVSDWTIVHQTGPRQIDQVRQTYQEQGYRAEVESFFHDMPQRYARASLVISRAGATTLAELACAGVAMILLPFPHAADDHQRANAQVFVDRRAALMIQHAANADATADQLAGAIRQLAEDVERRRVMGLAAKQLAYPDAARQIVSVIAEAIDQKRSR